jgi:hypothetical protein
MPGAQQLAGTVGKTTPARNPSSLLQPENVASNPNLTATGPPLLLNEKSATEAAEAVDPKTIRRGQRKVKIQKFLLTAFDISAK